LLRGSSRSCWVFWASQQFFPARAALLIVWVGFLALFRGIFEIVLAFEVRGADRPNEDGYRPAAGRGGALRELRASARDD
jgi:hypothetical protein